MKTTDDPTYTPLDKAGPLSLFSRHGLAGLVIGAQFILIFYMMMSFNATLGEHTAVMRELKVLIGTIVR